MFVSRISWLSKRASKPPVARKQACTMRKTLRPWNAFSKSNLSSKLVRASVSTHCSSLRFCPACSISTTQNPVEDLFPRRAMNDELVGFWARITSREHATENFLRKTWIDIRLVSLPRVPRLGPPQYCIDALRIGAKQLFSASHVPNTTPSIPDSQPEICTFALPHTAPNHHIPQCTLLSIYPNPDFEKRARESNPRGLSSL